MDFHWSLSDSKSPQVSRTLLNILAVLNNVVVGWSPLVLLFPSPPVPLIIFWWLYQKHQSRLVWLSSSCSMVFFQFPILIFTFFQFYFVVSQDSKVHNFASSLSLSLFFFSFFFLLIIIRSGLLVEIRWSVCMPKSLGSLCVSFSRTDAVLCIYHLFVWSNSCTSPSGSPCPSSRV